MRRSIRNSFLCVLCVLCGDSFLVLREPLKRASYPARLMVAALACSLKS